MLVGWPKDGSLVYGIRSTETHHIVLGSMDPEARAGRAHRRLGIRAGIDTVRELNGTT